MKPTPPKRRVLTAREKLMRERHTRLVKQTDGQALFLTVGVQSFQIKSPLKPKLYTDWMRDMLAIALARIEL